MFSIFPPRLLSVDGNDADDLRREPPPQRASHEIIGRCDRPHVSEPAEPQYIHQRKHIKVTVVIGNDDRRTSLGQQLDTPNVGAQGDHHHGANDQCKERRAEKVIHQP